MTNTTTIEQELNHAAQMMWGKFLRQPEDSLEIVASNGVTVSVFDADMVLPGKMYFSTGEATASPETPSAHLFHMERQSDRTWKIYGLHGWRADEKFTVDAPLVLEALQEISA